MEADTKMGPDAAGTAIRTLVVPFGKQTVLLCLKSEDRASGLYVGGAQ
jgi:hypothetical protein